MDFAVFINCPSRQGYRYVVAFTDHAMIERSEFISTFKDFNDVKLKSYGVKIRHYHADGGKELISKEVISILKLLGATYSWSPADTPELNVTSERKSQSRTIH